MIWERLGIEEERRAKITLYVQTILAEHWAKEERSDMGEALD